MAVWSAFGDTPDIRRGHWQGGDQELPGATPSEFRSPNFPEEVRLFGDALLLGGRAGGGNDILYSPRGVRTQLLVLGGDAEHMEGRSRGGDDRLGFSGPKGWLYGDAITMGGHAVGGDDHLVASAGSGTPRRASVSTLYGDAADMWGHARGGDDVLIGPVGGYHGDSADLYGDAWRMSGHACGGDDRLVGSSTRNERMWGDAAVIEGPHVRTGADVFVFGGHMGKDSIHDFERGKDLVDLTALAAQGIHGFEDLAPLLSETGDGSLILFGREETRFYGVLEDSITFLGIRCLGACDFLFA